LLVGLILFFVVVYLLSTKKKLKHQSERETEERVGSEKKVNKRSIVINIDYYV